MAWMEGMDGDLGMGRPVVDAEARSRRVRVEMLLDAVLLYAVD